MTKNPYENDVIFGIFSAGWIAGQMDRGRSREAAAASAVVAFEEYIRDRDKDRVERHAVAKSDGASMPIQPYGMKMF